MNDLFTGRKFNPLDITDRDEINIKKFKQQFEGGWSVPTVDKHTECHVTPEDPANRMVQYLQPHYEDRILEPSAGTGQLINALFAGGVPPCNITAVERNVQLAQYLDSKYQQREEREDRVDVRMGDFLNIPPDHHHRFNKVIMNPPFRQTDKHIKHALAMLVSGGVMIALVQSNYEGCEHDVLEELPHGTFTTTSVATKIIRIVK